MIITTTPQQRTKTTARKKIRIISTPTKTTKTTATTRKEEATEKTKTTKNRKTQKKTGFKLEVFPIISVSQLLLKMQCPNFSLTLFVLF